MTGSDETNGNGKKEAIDTLKSNVTELWKHVNDMHDKIHDQDKKIWSVTSEVRIIQAMAFTLQACLVVWLKYG